MNIVYGIGQCNIPYGGSRIIFEHVNRLIEMGHDVEIWTFWHFEGVSPFPTKAKIIEIPHEYDEQTDKLLSLYPERTSAINPDIFIACSFSYAFASQMLPHAKSFWYLQHDWEGRTYEGSSYPTAAVIKTYEEAFTLPINFLSNSQWTQRAIKDNLWC